jgi:hypothetical protein
MKTNALWFSTIIFLVVTLLHFARYLKGWTIMFDGFNVPVQWSLYAGIIFAFITLWMFLAAKK